MSVQPELGAWLGENQEITRDVEFDQGDFFAELRDMMETMGAQNPRMESLAYELSGTMGRIFSPEPPPQHAAEWMHCIEHRFGRQVVVSLIKYLDEILVAARPLVHGLACGRSSYLCKVTVEPDDTKIQYAGRSDEFVLDANRLIDEFRRADYDIEQEGQPQLITEKINDEIIAIGLKQSEPRDTHIPSMFLEPSQVFNELQKKIPKPSTEGHVSHEGKAPDYTAWRKSLVDMLAHIQVMVDEQNRNGWKLKPSDALGLPDEPAFADLRAYADENFTQQNLKHFLRGELFNRQRRGDMRAVLEKNGSTHTAYSKATAEEVVDRMMLRYLTKALVEQMNKTVPSAETEERFGTLFVRHFSLLLDILGGGIGRVLGPKISPQNEPGEELTVLWDVKYEGEPFDTRMVDFLKLADSLAGIISIVQELRSFFDPIKPMVPLSSLSGKIPTRPKADGHPHVTPLFEGEGAAVIEAEEKTMVFENLARVAHDVYDLLEYFQVTNRSSPHTLPPPEPRAATHGLPPLDTPSAKEPPMIRLSGKPNPHAAPPPIQVVDIGF